MPGFAVDGELLRQEQLALREDPLIVEMAEGLMDVPPMLWRNVVDPDGDPTIAYAIRAADEYKLRGGKLAKSVGGVARAVLAVFHEQVRARQVH